MNEENGLKPLLVTTAHRGVFLGWGVPSDALAIRLKRARMVIHWPKETKGVLGLAAASPPKGSRITPEVPEIILRDVTSVAVCATSKGWDIWS